MSFAAGPGDVAGCGDDGIAGSVPPKSLVLPTQTKMSVMFQSPSIETAVAFPAPPWQNGPSTPNAVAALDCVMEGEVKEPLTVMDTLELVASLSIMPVLTVIVTTDVKMLTLEVIFDVPLPILKFAKV
jgi:hypothetical protein